MRLAAHGIGIKERVTPAIPLFSEQSAVPFGIGEEPNLHQNNDQASALVQQQRPAQSLGATLCPCAHARGREEVLVRADCS